MNDEDMYSEEPAAIMGSTVRSQTMADSSLRIVVDVSPMDMQAAFRLFGSPGTAVALARMTNEVAVEHERPKADPDRKPYGQEAMALYQSSFFRRAYVWEAIGTDTEYLEWVKHRASAKSGEFSEYHDNGEKYCIPAHVRRVEHGSGTAIKPPYSAIPLTNQEHHLAHSSGDSSIEDEDWWDKTRIKYVHLWCWETAKKQIQLENPGSEYNSFGTIPPKLVEGWAMRRNIHQYLPNVYKGHVNAESAESQTESEA